MPKIDLLIDNHHMEIIITGEAINLVNNFKIKNVILNGGKFNALEKELINVLNE